MYALLHTMSIVAPWRSRIERLGFREKLGLIPSVAAVALTAILLLNVAAGLITDVRQHTIETRYYPAVHAARDLQGELRAVQRALQEAISIGDSAALASADSLRRAFTHTARQARALPADSAFAAYYTRARWAAAQMIRSGQRDGDLRNLDDVARRHARDPQRPRGHSARQRDGDRQRVPHDALDPPRRVGGERARRRGLHAGARSPGAPRVGVDRESGARSRARGGAARRGRRHRPHGHHVRGRDRDAARLDAADGAIPRGDGHPRGLAGAG